MLNRIIKELTERRAEMALAVFEHPPSNWDEFQKRLGRYIELEELLRLVITAAKGEEHDE